MMSMRQVTGPPLDTGSDKMLSSEHKFRFVVCRNEKHPQMWHTFFSLFFRKTTNFRVPW